MADTKVFANHYPFIWITMVQPRVIMVLFRRTLFLRRFSPSQTDEFGKSQFWWYPPPPPSSLPFCDFFYHSSFFLSRFLHLFVQLHLSVRQVTTSDFWPLTSLLTALSFFINSKKKLYQNTIKGSAPLSFSRMSKKSRNHSLFFLRHFLLNFYAFYNCYQSSSTFSFKR